MDINKILKQLTTDEKEQLFVLLKKDIGSIPQLDKIKSKLNQDQKILCPHCHGDDVYGHGEYKSRKRYKCKQCKKHLMILQAQLFQALRKWISFRSI